MIAPTNEWLMKMAEIEDGKCTSVGGLAVDCVVHVAPDSRTRLQKLRDRLFPARHCLTPAAPSEFKDCIHGYAVTKLPFKDRIRVLLTGVVVTSWQTVTEHEIGRSVTNAECWVGTSKDMLTASDVVIAVSGQETADTLSERHTTDEHAS